MFLRSGGIERRPLFGDSIGINNVGWMIESGRGGLKKDDSTAMQMYKLAAAKGDSFGMTNLARFYEHGLGGSSKERFQSLPVGAFLQSCRCRKCFGNGYPRRFLSEGARRPY